MAALTARGRGLDCLQPQPRQPVLRAGRTLCVQTNWAARCSLPRLPTVRFSLAGSSLPPGLRARRARFPTCGVIRVAGYSVVWDCDPTPHILLKSTKRSAATIIRSQRSFITFHGALRNILLSVGFPTMFHMITSEQTFVNNLSQKIFSCWCHI